MKSGRKPAILTANSRIIDNVTIMPNGCWEWNGARRKSKKINGHIMLNYGLMKFAGEVLAHRSSWRIFRGDIPENTMVCHSCDNPPCVNPDHLFLGSALDNATDCKKKNRTPVGMRHVSSKLTDDIVRKMRVEYIPFSRKYGAAALSRKYGVCGTIVSQAIRGVRWSHII